MAVVTIGVLALAGGTPDSQRSDESRAQALGEQLKCLQCAGESVAASQAPLAQQFRNEIDRQLDQGATDTQILEWFADRYGDEVLLDPPTSGLSVLIWVLPVLVVLTAVVGFWFAFGRWRTAAAMTQPTTDTASDPADVARDASSVVSDPSDAVDTTAEPVGTGRWRTPVVVAGALVFAGLAAWLVVWGSSDRGDGELTGGAGTGATSGEIARCQPLARTDPEAGIECFDAILKDDPDNVEALTYRGWAHMRAEDVPAGRVDLERAIELDPNAADPHVFLAVAATNEGDFAAAASELQQFWSNDPSEVAISVVQTEGLERKIFFGLMSDPTRGCWQGAASRGEDGPIDQAFLDDLGSCLDDVLADTPDDRDARLSRALAHLGPQAADTEAARALLDGLLAEDPDDADALALIVSLDLKAGDLDAAEVNLEHLEQLPRGVGAFLIGDAATLRSVVEESRKGG